MATSSREVRVLVMGASRSSTSFNNRLAALAAACLTHRGGAVDHSTIAEFEAPFYSADVEKASGAPPGARRFADRLMEADALVIASPEYNASMPGELKNLIDWVSRLRPQPFIGRQALLLSASPSMAGGNRGLWSLRIPLEHLGARVYPDMFSLAQAHKAFDANGAIADATLQKRLDETIYQFLDLVEAAKHYPGLKKTWVEFLGEQPDRAIDRVERSAA
jgi:NAD(P)H-dependent FMN reductase